jgi:hypothetical protein
MYIGENMMLMFNVVVLFFSASFIVAVFIAETVKSLKKGT